MYRNKSQSRLLSSLLALVVLLSQSAFAFASLDMMSGDSDRAMRHCHNMASQVAAEQQQATTSGQDKTCQQDCCDSNDCNSHCFSCVAPVTGGLVSAAGSLSIPQLSEQVFLSYIQAPSGHDPSNLYRPPRELI